MVGDALAALTESVVSSAVSSKRNQERSQAEVLFLGAGLSPHYFRNKGTCSFVRLWIVLSL